MKPASLLDRSGAYLFVALTLVAACSSAEATKTDATSVAPDDAATPEPARDGPPGRADVTAQPDAVSYPPNSRKCSLSFGQASDCECADGTPGASDPGQCSTASVVTSQIQQGVCCKDAFGCECIGYTCASNASTCVCSNIGDMMLPADSTAVRECAPSTGQKCCLQRYTHRCVCSSSSQCTETGAVPVDACRVVDVAACASDATSLTNCK